MSFRRFSMSQVSPESETDEQISFLYPSLQSLEQRCDLSLKESKSNPTNNPESVRTITALPMYEVSPDIVMSHLPRGYFDPTHDPVLEHLEDISSWNEGLIEKFMNKIEETDMNKDIIVGHLTTMIDSNYDELMGCMSNIQSINVELYEAQMQINHARMKIKASKDLMDNGLLRVTRCSNKRSRLLKISETIKALKDIKDIHRIMIDKLNMGDIGEAAKIAKTILEHLRDNNFDQFRALKSLKDGMQKNIFSIRRKADKSLKRIVCRKFSSVEYENVITSYIALDRLTDELGIETVDGSYEEDSFSYDNFQCIDGLAQRINRFQLEDIDACLHSAVMEFIYVAQQKKQKAAKEIAIAGAFSQLGATEIFDLAEVPLNVLCRRLSTDQVPLCIVRSCELLADIVHTHYLITQWHLSPFDPKNDDTAHLHRCTIDRSSGSKHLDPHPDRMDKTTDDVCEDEEEVEVFHNKSSLLPNGENMDEHQRLYRPDAKNLEATANSLKLSDSFKSLVRSRSILWEELLRDLVAMLQMANFTVEVKLEDFASMMWSLRVMILLGSEFCNSDSQILLNCMKEKSEEFFRNFHVESLQFVRVMIEVEMWQNIAINIESGNILTVVRKTFARDILNYSADNGSASDTKRSARRGSLMMTTQHALEASKEEAINQSSSDLDSADSVLMKFESHCNPFRFILHGNDGDIDGGLLVKPLPKYLFSTSGVWSLPESSFLSPQSKKGKSDKSSYMATQASFNGLAKFLSKYLHIMSLMPSLSSEIFTCLCQLFDYYLCSVFFGFMPVEERAKFLAAQAKTTSAAPDQSRDFEALRFHIEKSFGDVVYLPLLPGQENSQGSVETTGGSGVIESSETSTSSPMSSVNSGHSLYNQSMALSGQYFATKVLPLLRVPEVVSTADLSSCYALNERIVAAESCWFVAQMLSESRHLLGKLLPENDFERCESYIDNFGLVMGQLRSLLYRVNGPQLVNYTSTLSSIVDCSWDSRKLRETHHDWVDALVDSCRQVWEYMMLTDQFAEASTLVREQVWMEVCQAALDVTIDGFSKVRKCSAEGRAAMTMDLFSLYEGLNNIHLCRPPRGKHYIDNYLQAFYLNEDDMMGWIQENWQAYAYRHMHGMITQTMSSMLNNKKLRDAIAVIDSLYEVEDKDSSFKFTTMLSTRLKEDGKLSNLISSTFRR